MSALEFESFDAVMHNKIVAVPDYQRDYSWSKAELTTLWDDIEALWDRSPFEANASHFIGSIVLIPFDKDLSSCAAALSAEKKLGGFKKYNIIDGQQRISTISILLVSVRDYAASNGIELNEDVNSLLDTKKPDSEGNPIPVLHFSQENTQRCYNSILYGIDAEYDGRKRGARRILAAKRFFDEMIAGLFDGCEDVQDRLNRYVDDILYSLELVEIDCNEDSDAFQIFESLNATGVPLTPAEQVKNLVLMRSGTRDVSLSRWEKIVEDAGEDDFVEFLAQYLFCKKNRRISRKDIYAEFKDEIKEKGVSDVLDDMRVYGAIFRQLKNPLSGSEAASSLKDLEYLGQRQAYVPLMLAARRFGIKSKDFAAISDALLVFIVRHQVCSQSTNKLDSVFSRTCDCIKDEAKSPGDIISFFRNEQMPDDVFREMFRSLSFPYSGAAQKRARVYLKRMEEKAKGVNAPWRLQDSDLSVEHIMPKQPSIADLNEWIGEEEAEQLRESDPQLDDFSERVIMSIGNLALLFVPENSAASNRSYKEKREHYQTSLLRQDGERCVPAETFTLIRDLLDAYPETFAEKDVSDRAGRLADQAVEVWR